ncbi:MAG: hypothetical protein QF464_02185, partial [Myxococcota bacterium]|nr:hypothetical protein [Myxococcota bacterium]
MPRTTNLLLALTIALWSFAACSVDDSVSDGADTTTPPIDIPEHECGFDAQCDGKFTDLTPCEDAVCEAGTCVKQIRGTWTSCDHPDAGECDGGYCDQDG